MSAYTGRYFAVSGDSQSQASGTNCFARETYPHVLARLLTDRSAPFRERNFALSGASTPGYVLNSIQNGNIYGIPDMAFVNSGVNDPPTVSKAETQAALEKVILAYKFEVMGGALRTPDGRWTNTDTTNGVVVAGPDDLPRGGTPGQRYIVSTDDSSTGGITANPDDPDQHPTITGAGSNKITVWECRYPIAGEFGWGRVAKGSTTPFACKRIGVISTPYLNISNGDNLEGRTPTGEPYKYYAEVREAQQAAVTAQAVNVGGLPSVVYIDLYGFLKKRIEDGLDPDDSGGYTAARNWHRGAGNQHLNAYGHRLVAECCQDVIETEGWTDGGRWTK